MKPNDLPRITLVMPSFNQAQYLEEAICSVLEQNYPNLEFMILDGGSTDGSKEIIERYSETLTFWHSRPDKGQTKYINAYVADGFCIKQTDFITANTLAMRFGMILKRLERIFEIWALMREKEMIGRDL